MNNINKIANLDLNLLTVFQVLMQSGSVTASAKVLNLSQPAASHALSRLRLAFGDPLFVKTSKAMVPTPRALQLAPFVKDILSRIEKDVLDGGEFLPQNLERTFRIKTTDYIEALLVPKMLERVLVEAPKAQVSLTSAEFHLPREQLEQGSCDLAIAGFFGDLPDGFYQQKLFEDEFMCAVRTKHPRLGKKRSVDLESYCEEQHVLIAPGGNLRGKVDELLAAKKQTRHIVGGISSFMTSGWIVDQADVVLTAPAQLIEMLSKRFALNTFLVPIKVPKVTIVQAWHERNNSDAAHRWLREMVRDVLQK